MDHLAARMDVTCMDHHADEPSCKREQEPVFIHFKPKIYPPDAESCPAFREPLLKVSFPKRRFSVACVLLRRTLVVGGLAVRACGVPLAVRARGVPLAVGARGWVLRMIPVLSVRATPSCRQESVLRPLGCASTSHVRFGREDRSTSCNPFLQTIVRLLTPFSLICRCQVWPRFLCWW